MESNRIDRRDFLKASAIATGAAAAGRYLHAADKGAGVPTRPLGRTGEHVSCVGEGGAMEGMLEAKKAGKVRFIGFTGHKDPYVHLRMLDHARERNFHFDTVQMPLNVMDAHFRSFTHEVLPVLNREGIAPLGMKC